jgi:hypothetical protein
MQAELPSMGGKPTDKRRCEGTQNPGKKVPGRSMNRIGQKDN